MYTRSLPTLGRLSRHVPAKGAKNLSLQSGRFLWPVQRGPLRGRQREFPAAFCALSVFSMSLAPRISPVRGGFVSIAVRVFIVRRLARDAKDYFNYFSTRYMWKSGWITGVWSVFLEVDGLRAVASLLRRLHRALPRTPCGDIPDLRDASISIEVGRELEADLRGNSMPGDRDRGWD